MRVIVIRLYSYIKSTINCLTHIKYPAIAIPLSLLVKVVVAMVIGIPLYYSYFCCLIRVKKSYCYLIGRYSPISICYIQFCLFLMPGLLLNPFIFFFYSIASFFLPIHFKSKISLSYFDYFCSYVFFLLVYSKCCCQKSSSHFTAMAVAIPILKLSLTSSFSFPVKFRCTVLNSESS